VCEHLVFSKKMDMHRLLHQLPNYHQRSEHPRLLKATIIAKNERVLKELVLAEASLSGQDEEGNTLLHLAAMNDASSCSEILIESNEIYLDQYNLFGYTALHCAAHFGHVGILEQLIESGSDLDKKTKSGQSALYLSITGEHLGVLIC
jgi:ankyrin repeat protein